VGLEIVVPPRQLQVLMQLLLVSWWVVTEGERGVSGGSGSSSSR